MPKLNREPITSVTTLNGSAFNQPGATQSEVFQRAVPMVGFVVSRLSLLEFLDPKQRLVLRWRRMTMSEITAHDREHQKENERFYKSHRFSRTSGGRFLGRSRALPNVSGKDRREQHNSRARDDHPILLSLS